MKNGYKYVSKRKEESCLAKYGCKDPGNSKEAIERRKETCLAKYGVDNPLKSEKIKEKLKHTCLIKYGVTNGGWTPQSIKKIQETNLKVRGVTCPFKDDKVKEKIKNTCLKKYGVSSASKSKEIKERNRLTRISNYRKEHYNDFLNMALSSKVEIFLLKVGVRLTENIILRITRK